RVHQLAGRHLRLDGVEETDDPRGGCEQLVSFGAVSAGPNKFALPPTHQEQAGAAQTCLPRFQAHEHNRPREGGALYLLVRLSGLARHEYWLLAVLLTCAAFLSYGDAFAARLSQPEYLLAIFAWLFVAILGSGLSVVRHAERLAVQLGEPYG